MLYTDGSNDYAEGLGTALLALLFFMLLFCSITFIIMQPINFVQFPLSLLCSLAWVYMLVARGRVFLKIVLTTLGIIAGSILFCSFVYDTGYDSYSYHLNIVANMVHGWNPFFEDPPDNSLWARHYAKGMEMMQAVVFGFTRNIQSVRCVNFILACAAASVAWYTLKRVFRRISYTWRWCIVCLIFANPVVLSQLTTAYNDYALWLEIVILAASFLLMYYDDLDTTAYIWMFFIFSIGITTKFTHFFYLGILCIFFAVWCILTRQYFIVKAASSFISVSVALGIVIMANNPYLTNFVDYGNPFYPLLGRYVDIMSQNTPEMYIDGGRITNFAKSLLSVGNEEWGSLTGGFSLNDFVQTYSYDARVNGFGILMAPALIASFVLMLLNKASKQWWIVYIFCLLMAFCFDQAWWARYVPFIWALIIIPILYYANSCFGEYEVKRKLSAKRIIASLVVVIVMSNALMAIAISLTARASYTSYLNYIAAAQKASGKKIRVANFNSSFRETFDDLHINYENYPSDSLLKSPDKLYTICNFIKSPVIAELPPEDFPALYDAPKGIWGKVCDFSKRRYHPVIPSESKMDYLSDKPL